MCCKCNNSVEILCPYHVSVLVDESLFSVCVSLSVLHSLCVMKVRIVPETHTLPSYIISFQFLDFSFLCKLFICEFSYHGTTVRIISKPSATSAETKLQ